MSSTGLSMTNSTNLAESISEMLNNLSSLKELDFSWNHFEGESGRIVIQALIRNDYLRRLNLAHNVLGAGDSPAVDEFGEVFKENVRLEYLNLSFNMI